MIGFNRPYLTGKETEHIYTAVHQHRHASGNGIFTKKCQQYFESRWGFKKCLLTTSCTDALEMTALLLDIKPGDEIIVPSYTFVSSALTFVRQGAKIVFADSRADHPGIDEDAIEPLITEKTRAIVVVHYAGVACNMDKIMALARQYKLSVIEDAAQAVDSYYKDQPLGSIGDFGCFSFHETKNIQCGEGGMLAINNEAYTERAEILWEKGTNRASFFRGEVDKYGWVDVGSSFLPADIIAAFLYAQLESLEDIQQKRLEVWAQYNERLQGLAKDGKVQLPAIPEYATNNAHMYYLVFDSLERRQAFIKHGKENGIHCVFHYVPLHSSAYYTAKHDGRPLPNCDKYGNCLVRIPLFYDLTEQEINKVSDIIIDFFKA